MIRPIYTLLTVLFIALVGNFWHWLGWGPQGEPFHANAAQNAQLLQLTGTGARLAGADAIQTAVVYAQTIYAAAQDKDRPGAVVLVRDDDPAVAMASTRLQHFPINAPMLFVTEGGTVLPPATQAELERLDPEGVMMDHNVQVYLLGRIDPAVNTVVRNLGFNTRQITAADPIEYAEVLDEFLAVLDSYHADSVLVAQIDALPYAYGAANWNAHMGQGWAFVTADGVPDATRRMLERRQQGYPYIYVFAPPDVVSVEVLAELSQYGHVQRIPGATPQEMVVRWAGYKDLGRAFGWWFGKAQRYVGWGYAEPGHNLLLAPPDDWRVIVPSGVLSHMGKHGMLLLTNEDGQLSDAVRNYLAVLQPPLSYPSQQLFTYAWFLGPNLPDETMRTFSDLITVQGIQPEAQ